MPSPLAGRRFAIAWNQDWDPADREAASRKDVEDVAGHVREALRELGASSVDVPVVDDAAAAVARMRDLGVEAVFNLCETFRGSSALEPLLPLLCEAEGLPVTGASALTLGLAVHKGLAKDVLRGRGLPTAWAVLARRPADVPADVAFPIIVKPSREDASTGIHWDSVVRDRGSLDARIEEVTARYRQPALVEAYIDGREIYASLLARPDGSWQVLPFYEIDFSTLPAGRPHIVTYDGKWSPDTVDFVATKPVALEVDEATARRLADTACAAADALGLRDYGRVDFRLARDGTPFVLEVNPNCDLSASGGGFARAVRAAGLSYAQLCERLGLLALARGAATTARPGTAAAAHDTAASASRGGPSGGAGSIQVRALRVADEAPLRAMLADSEAFRPEEVEVAEELLGVAVRRARGEDTGTDDYEAMVAETPDGTVLGYACFGPTPMTEATWDLYWIVTAPAARGRGVGARLMAGVEVELARRGAQTIRVETSSLEGQGGARRFYLKLGYGEVGLLRDFYRSGDHLHVLTKRLHD